MKRGALTCRSGAWATLRCRVPATASSSATLPTSCITVLQRRSYAIPSSKEDNKKRNKQARLKRLLRDPEDKSDKEVVTPDNFERQFKYRKGLVDYTLKKTESDSPHVKEFVYTASGDQLSYDSLAQKLELISQSFKMDKDRTLRLAALFKEIRDREFELAAKEAALVAENPKLSKEEKEWFGLFPEFSGLLDEAFLSESNRRLNSILRDLPEEQALAKREDETKRDRNYGRQLIPFAHDKEIYVGGHFLFSDEEVAKYLPEGMSGQLLKLNGPFLNDKHTILRKRTHSVIAELDRRNRKKFLGTTDTKSIIFDGPPGSGKSIALNQIVMWARMNGWLVVWVPDGEAFVGGARILPSRIEPGYFDQRHKATELATSLLKAHGDKLSNLKIKNNFQVRQFSSKDKTLADLLNYGTSEPRAVMACMYWFRRELNRVTEYPVLIAIDGYNHLYHWSDYWNPEDSARYRPRTLPAQKLSLTKWFSGHQDHGLINGTMVCALRGATPTGSYFEQNGRRHCVTIPNYNDEEFQEAILHYKDLEWIPPDLPKFTASYIYAMTEGNPKEVFKFCGSL